MPTPTRTGIGPSPGPHRPLAFIAEPARLNPVLRLVVRMVERDLKQPFVPGRLLGWAPRHAIPFAVVGWFGDHPGALGRRRRTDPSSDQRLLGLVRLAASYASGSPYCEAMNLAPAPSGLTSAELDALRCGADGSGVPSLTRRERTAIRYAQCLCATPLHFPDELVAELTATFTEREIVCLAATAAAIDYQARLIEALGVPAPEGVGVAR